MQAYPHRYEVSAAGGTEGEVTVTSQGLPALASAPPAQFGGPGDRWSPETFLVAAAADCFVLSFRAVAAASKLPWRHLACAATGVLDRADGGLRFTQLQLHATLVLPSGGDIERAQRLLEKSDKVCLITNSLALAPELTTEVTTE